MEGYFTLVSAIDLHLIFEWASCKATVVALTRLFTQVMARKYPVVHARDTGAVARRASLLGLPTNSMHPMRRHTSRLFIIPSLHRTHLHGAGFSLTICFTRFS